MKVLEIMTKFGVLRQKIVEFSENFGVLRSKFIKILLKFQGFKVKMWSSKSTRVKNVIFS